MGQLDSRGQEKEKEMKELLAQRVAEETMSAEGQAIQGVIDRIWGSCGPGQGGALDKEEAKRFVRDTLGNLGRGELPDAAFEEVFATLDKFPSGTIEKSEMVALVKKLLGI